MSLARLVCDGAPFSSEAIWQGAAGRWLEAEVVAAPVKTANEPRVLVRRRVPDLCGPNGEEVCVFPGYPFISLFTGAGGMDIGLESAGFTCVVQCEWMTAACETLIANRPRYFRDAALIQGDLRQTTTGMLLREGGLECGEVYLVAGGPPCQGFSNANKHALVGRYDERNDLVYEFLRVVNEARPKYFIMENVPGFFNFNGGEYAEEFLHRAYGAYYELVYGFADAVEYGVPQCRCRFFCMGTRRDLVEKGQPIASLPRPQNFAERDLSRLVAADGAPLLAWNDEEIEALRAAPGIRYFPDRPVLKPPKPVAQEGGRSQSFMKFWRELRRNEPDRIVEAAQ